jgi:cysteine desulfurase family protein
MIYLDHPATSWPKPPEVIRAIVEFLEVNGGNPGRSGHSLSVAAGRIVYETREAIARFFNAPDPLRVILTHNATHALNIALQGILKPGDVVVTTSIEHNSVMRPLRTLEKRGVDLRIVPCDATGTIDTESYCCALNLKPRLVVITHASNVVGRIMPIDRLAGLAHEVGALVLVDAAQTCGVVPIDVQTMGIDLLAFTGHKGLQGPPGTGGLVIGRGVASEDIEPFICGGTGSNSAVEEQPLMLPDKLEGGTLNGPGIAGLGAAVKWIEERGLETVKAHHDELISQLVSGLADTPGVTIYGPQPGESRVPLVSFTIEGKTVSDVGLRLDRDFGILCRVGLHCAPAAHRTLGTFSEGTIRFGVGPMTTRNEVEQALSAVARIARE